MSRLKIIKKVIPVVVDTTVMHSKEFGGHVFRKFNIYSDRSVSEIAKWEGQWQTAPEWVRSQPQFAQMKRDQRIYRILVTRYNTDKWKRSTTPFSIRKTLKVNFRETIVYPIYEVESKSMRYEVVDDKIVKINKVSIDRLELDVYEYPAYHLPTFMAFCFVKLDETIERGVYVDSSEYESEDGRGTRTSTYRYYAEDKITKYKLVPRIGYQWLGEHIVETRERIFSEGI